MNYNPSHLKDYIQSITLIKQSPPWLPILISNLIHHHSFFRLRDYRSSSKRLVLQLLDLIIPSLIIYLLILPPHDDVTCCLLRPLYKIFRHWPNIIPQKSHVKNKHLRAIIHGGPLGNGCAKIIESFVAYLLLIIRYDYTTLYPPPLHLGPLPSLSSIGIVAVFSLIVNYVLSLWSRLTSSRGNHRGVHEMLSSLTSGQDEPSSSSIFDNLKILSLAALNAICEEIISRGFFMSHYQRHLDFKRSNVAQATMFGLWHWNGIPSGPTGVALTFVYGLIMGWMVRVGGGLLLPIVTHTVADYFIFAVVVKRKLE